MYAAASWPASPRRAVVDLPSSLREKCPLARRRLAAVLAMASYGLAGPFDQVASVIQRQEGWFPGSVSYRLNNPGNLMYASQPGASPHPILGSDGKTRIFAEFPSFDQGYQALLNQISLDASRGETIAQFAAKYAPASDSNDPASYAAQIAAAAGLSVDSPLSQAGQPEAAAPADSADSGDASSSEWTPYYIGAGIAAGLLVALISSR